MQVEDKVNIIFARAQHGVIQREEYLIDMSTKATWEEPIDGSPVSILERYRVNCYALLETKVMEASENPIKKNEIYQRYGSITRYREACERKAEKKIRQRALSLGVVYRPSARNCAKKAWIALGDQYLERRAQNDDIITSFSKANQSDVSLSVDAGRMISRFAKHAGLDLDTFNRIEPHTVDIFDEWHRIPKRLTITARCRGDLVVMTWKDRSYSTRDSSQDSYTFFRGQDRWLLVGFESTLSTMWPYMQLVDVILGDNVITGALNRSPQASASISGKKDSKFAHKPPKLELTVEGRLHQHKLNNEVTHLITQRKITPHELSSERRNSISNPRLSFLGALNHTVLGYRSEKARK